MEWAPLFVLGVPPRDFIVTPRGELLMVRLLLWREEGEGGEGSFGELALCHWARPLPLSPLPNMECRGALELCALIRAKYQASTRQVPVPIICSLSTIVLPVLRARETVSANHVWSKY